MPGELWALFGAMLFGTGHLAVRRAHETGWSNQGALLSATLINVLCYLVGCLWLVWSGQLPPIQVEAVVLFLVAGLFTAFLGRMTLWAAIERIGAARAASYRVTSPIVTVTLAYLLIGERLSLEALLGAAVIVIGVWLLTRETSSATKARPPKGRTPRGLAIGIALGLASSAAFGSGQVFRKIGLGITPLPMLGALVGTSVGLAIFGLGAVRDQGWRELLGLARLRYAWPLWLSGFLTAAAQFSIFYSYEHARVSTASVLGATEPVWTFVAGSLLMRRQEAPTWRLALSILIICGGSAVIVGRG
jgi:drug/metabolite transporter (DMT)-like permease